MLANDKEQIYKYCDVSFVKIEILMEKENPFLWEFGPG
jgi:hypothetical protein